eukprot:6308732-Alexandrium_andersonii.AAC.1
MSPSREPVPLSARATPFDLPSDPAETGGGDDGSVGSDLGSRVDGLSSGCVPAGDASSHRFEGLPLASEGAHRSSGLGLLAENEPRDEPCRRPVSPAAWAGRGVERSLSGLPDPSAGVRRTVGAGARPRRPAM